MSYLRTPTEAEATGDVAAMFAADRATAGYLPNFTRTFGLRPEVYRAWQQLMGSVRGGMDLRRYELATVAAARRRRSSYCALAHGKVLREKFHDGPTVQAIVTDPHAAGLDPVDVAVLEFADKVAADPAGVAEADVEVLRGHGLSDPDIFQVVLAVAARCFFSTVLDATGTEPDAAYRETIEPELRQALTVGRPIAAPLT